MFQDSPIYDRLIAECGDVPAQVRREAERVSRELESVMRPLRSPGYGPGLDRPQQALATAGSAPHCCPDPGRTDPRTHPRVGAAHTAHRAVVIEPAYSVGSSGTGRDSHSAMVRAIGCSVSTSTNPNCPDWLHSRNHHIPSASSAKSKAPYASCARRM